MQNLITAIMMTIFFLSSSNSFANKEGNCQAHFISKVKDKSFEEALCVQETGVNINLNKNGAYSSSLCGKEWDISNQDMDLVFVEFRTKRKGDKYRFGVDILRGPEDINAAKRIAKYRGYIEKDGKVQGLIPINLKSNSKEITAISYDCQINKFDL